MHKINMCNTIFFNNLVVYAYFRGSKNNMMTYKFVEKKQCMCVGGYGRYDFLMKSWDLYATDQCVCQEKQTILRFPVAPQYTPQDLAIPTPEAVTYAEYWEQIIQTGWIGDAMKKEEGVGGTTSLVWVYWVSASTSL